MSTSSGDSSFIASRLTEMARDASRIGKAVRIMEVCGDHTVAIERAGIRQLLPENVKLISGPGCPICVTPPGYIDAMIQLLRRGDVLLATYGDMMKVPGSTQRLGDFGDCGANVRSVTSAFEAFSLAQDNPTRKVVFAAFGFETTVSQTADIVIRAKNAGMRNFHVFSGHKLTVPAMKALLTAGQSQVDGFLCPSHISIITGSDAYRSIVEEYHRPCVITGSEPDQIIDGLARIVSQLASRKAIVENTSTVTIPPSRDERVWKSIDAVFDITTADWRGLGSIPASGFTINETYSQFDAAAVYDLKTGGTGEPPGCQCESVIQGVLEPPQCPLFGKKCTLRDPWGTCMVSAQGTCRAWLSYRRYTQKLWIYDLSRVAYPW